MYRGVRRVVVGMSGGVDSTVSALLLKQRGLEVVGVFMKNWDGVDETGVCTADKDCEEAARVAEKLGIKFLVANFVKEYWTEVFSDLIEDYQAGLTPNPDVLCNSRIKFTHFHDYAMNQIGCDAIATGHYARNSYGENLELRTEDVLNPAFLLKSVDRTKDQTFFLSQMPQAALRNTMFPVGELPKGVVKQIAKQAGFPEIAAKKESMGICFVGKKKGAGGRGFQDFIGEYIDPKPGVFVDLDTAETVGSHNGVHQWTIGQRLRIKRGTQPYYVVHKDSERNVIQVVSEQDHPALYADCFFTKSPHWISGPPEALTSRAADKTLNCEFRFQNVAPLTKCVMSYNMSSTSNWEFTTRESLVISVPEPVKAITPGQFSAFYKGDVCLGSARIERPGPSLYTLNVGNCRTNIRDKLQSKAPCSS